MASLKLIVGTNDLAAFFGVTRYTVSKWAKAGCPQIKRGQWDLKEVFDWWWSNLASDRAAQEGDNDSMNEAKRLYWWEKAKGEALKVKQIEGDLVTWDEVSREWAKRAAEYKNGCFELENSLPPILEGKSQPEMRKLVYERVWSLFDRVCRTGAFCPKQKKANVKNKKKKTGKKKDK